MQKILCALMVLVLTACAEQKQNIVPGIVPNSVKEQKVIKILPKNVIGEIEPIYLPPMKSPFLSRVDTGATSSSLDAYEVKRFERDGKDWVSFKVINRESKEEYVFEKPLMRRVRIKRIGEEEHRMTVEMDVKMGGEKFKADFTVAERHDFEYQTLIGRNILGGRYAVDVSLSNTLK